MFEGLVDKANTPDELAGVIAHEMGHVAHRDGVRAVIQAAGLSFLFGMLIGDFSGGGAAVIAMRTVLQSSYSRETEAAADAWGAGLLTAAEWAALKKICQAPPQTRPRAISHAPSETPQAPRAASQERPGGDARRGALPRPESSGR